MKILGVYGSLRKGSFNRKLLETAKELDFEGVEIEIFEKLKDIPLYDQDKESDPNEAVRQLKSKAKDADAIIFATPEYNYSIPGVLKNAIDWASRPYGDNSWDGKPVAIMTASGGMIGGARAQYHLRQVFVFLNMIPINKPEVIVPMVSEKFDDKGQLKDIHTKDKIRELVEALIKWTLKIKKKEKIEEIAKEIYEYENAYSRAGKDKD